MIHQSVTQSLTWKRPPNVPFRDSRPDETAASKNAALGKELKD
jgi:hypothetical protein